MDCCRKEDPHDTQAAERMPRTTFPTQLESPWPLGHVMVVTAAREDSDVPDILRVQVIDSELQRITADERSRRGDVCREPRGTSDLKDGPRARARHTHPASSVFPMHPAHNVELQQALATLNRGGETMSRRQEISLEHGRSLHENSTKGRREAQRAGTKAQEG